MWSDIIAQDYDYFENWARIGAGNKFIAFQRSTIGPSNKEVRNEAIAKPKKPLEKRIIDQPLISTILA